MLQYTARITSQDTPRVGGRNLLLNSDKSLSNKEYYVGRYDISDPSLMVADEYYTIQIWGAAEGADYSESMWVYNSGVNTKVASIQKSENGVWQMTFKWKDDSKKLNRYLNLYRSANHPNIKKGYSTTIARIKLERGSIATDWAPAPEDVAESVNTVNTNLTNLANTLLDPEQGEIHKLTSLLGKHKQEVSQNFATANKNIEKLQEVSLTPQQHLDFGYLTDSLQILRDASTGGTLEGLTLQRYIALSGNGEDISAYLASNALGAVLKAGITGFGTPQEREQVAICHNGTGHIGNLYFTGNQIDFRTDEHTDPYLSIGAEEATFIETFLKQARLDDTPVTVSSINLTPTSTGYQRTITADNDGTRLTITLDRINIATFDNTFTRLTLDDETLAEWRGTITNREKYRNGILVLEPVRTPYEATGLTYERVVRAGTHTLRLQIINPQSPYTATINGLKVRRRYDTGAQQSALTKSGLRLFGSPDRYLDVDYRQRYTPNGGQYTVVNPYLVRIKGGAKIDKLTVDKIEGAGSKLSPIVTPQLGLGGQTTLYPKYDEWVLTSDSKEQQVSFGGLTAEVGKSIYIQTRKRAYLLANGHSFFGLPSVSDNQWLGKNTTYRFVRAEATSWLVTSSSSPYPWT